MIRHQYGFVNFRALFQLAKSGFSRKWRTDTRGFGRLVKHVNCFAPFAILHALAVLILYFILIPKEYSCVLWSPDIAYLSESSFPWRNALFSQAEKAAQWVFIFIGMSLYVFCVLFWSKLSKFGLDDHFHRSQRIYDTLRGISALQKARVLPEYRCLNAWAVNAQGIKHISDVTDRQQKNKTRHVFLRGSYMAVYLTLTPVGSLVLSIASLGYTLAKNVGSSEGILLLCGNSTAVVAISTLLQALLLKPMANKLVQIRLSVEISDSQAYSKTYTETLFYMGIWSKVVWPVLLTVFLDESCYRYYLKFSPDLNELFTFWGSGQTGTEAYRAGTCVRNVVSIFTPVWLTQMLVGLVIQPAWSMLSTHNLFRKTQEWGRRKLKQEAQTEHEYLEDNVHEAQVCISTVLVHLDVGVGFCMWAPILLLFACALIPFTFVALYMDAAREHTFVRNLVAFIKVCAPQ